MINQILCCPRCKKNIKKIKNFYFCPKCQKKYPIYFGIPDFRIFPDPYLTFNQEKELIGKIIKSTINLNYRDTYLETTELTNLYYQKNKVRGSSRKLHAKSLTYNTEPKERIKRRKRFLDIAYQISGKKKNLLGRALDLGCGMGGTLKTLEYFADNIIGTDISLKNLILAQKYAREFMKKNVQFVCASAEYLPFKDDVFSLINASDVIEHVKNQQKTLRSVKRILKENGIFYFNSINRYLILEGHVKVFFVGFVPRKYADAYVRLVSDQGYIGKKPLSYLELKNFMNQIFGYNKWKMLPNFSKKYSVSKPKTLLGKIYNKIPEKILLLSSNNSLVKFFQIDHKIVSFK